MRYIGSGAIQITAKDMIYIHAVDCTYAIGNRAAGEW